MPGNQELLNIKHGFHNLIVQEIVFLHVCALSASFVKEINAKDAIVATVNKRLSPGAAG